MRKSLLAALAFLPLASPAFATDWYLLDFQSRRRLLSSSGLTPERPLGAPVSLKPE